MTRAVPAIFKNTYTRGGRRHRLRGWSVRIQHDGVRRTLALQSTQREAAEKEAAQWHQRILADGWDALNSRPTAEPRESPPSIGRLPSHSSPAHPAYWLPRLVRRKYKGGAVFSRRPVLSARIEHAGEAWHFPLETEDPQVAARRASQIYRTASTQGWPAVFARHPREVTVAIFWHSSPACCTYTTLYSQLAAMPAIGAAPGQKRVAIIEPDAALGRALSGCVNRHPDLNCAAIFSSLAQAFKQLPADAPDVVLLNANMPGAWKSQARERIHFLISGNPVFTYGCFEESDHIFVHLTGVDAGYLLRRRKPSALLEPILGPTRLPESAARDAAMKIRDYFQNFFAEAPPMDYVESLASLSQREWEIAAQLRQGLTDKEIAASLGISIWTVRKHLRSIYAKLRVRSRTEAAVKLAVK